MEALYEWNNEFLTEHLTYPPLSLIDDVINTINTLLYEAVGAIEQYMHHLPSSTISVQEIEQGVHQIETFLENIVDRNFDAFELYALRNIFVVPENVRGWMRLKHQMNVDFSKSEQDFENIQSEISLVKNKIHAAYKVSRILENEEALNESILERLRASTKQLAFLSDISKEHDVKPLFETTDFLVNQTLVLQSLLTTLRSLGSAYDGKPLASLEREHYIEKSILHHLSVLSDENCDSVDAIDSQHLVHRFSNLE
ncbi:MIND complex subunit MTW1 [Pneumocystis jirovecii RU7]|uniref:Uncharacterized protein n=1 Tax=Pneumocystis jirovecii (strain RU7) TaxID=1408657 RepID=A0A0W4ZTT2_PNEJ7|nr:MIND complex subunit MTW1 [Pneumocystis jirovecii RU7]KTW31766.1 hypothetical protein T551_01027 [Pneumocystis jirovecii RU7]